MKAWIFSLKISRLGKIAAALPSILLAGTVHAMPAPVSAPAPTHLQTPQPTIAAPQQAASTPPKPRTNIAAKSEWKKLSPAQQHALAPLAEDWFRLDSFRKEKWLDLANRFVSMTPEEQARMQERMRDWVKLSPEQRRLARESYSRTKKLNAQQKSRQWQEYQQLPEEKKKQLAATAKPKKPLANPPRRHAGKGSAVKKPPQLAIPEQQSLPTAEATQSSTMPVPSTP